MDKHRKNARRFNRQMGTWVIDTAFDDDKPKLHSTVLLKLDPISSTHSLFLSSSFFDPWPKRFDSSKPLVAPDHEGSRKKNKKNTGKRSWRSATSSLFRGKR